ncbi:MAG: tyrosine--tRNA ligase, partial [Rhodospirillales bacterium]|nr:tyrosine--tRNA ligase [Rhodospirillales bacterium]
MATHRSQFLSTLTERGFVHQCTDDETLDALAAEKPLTAYIGFDCTAPSLHVGSLISIMMLKWLQEAGHKPIVLMGGGTTKVGDPSGKDNVRTLLDDTEITENMRRIKQVFSQFLVFGDGPTDAVMIDNSEWLDGLSYIPFLREYGRHFSINRMLG